MKKLEQSFPRDRAFPAVSLVLEVDERAVPVGAFRREEPRIDMVEAVVTAELEEFSKVFSLIEMLKRRAYYYHFDEGIFITLYRPEAWSFWTTVLIKTGPAVFIQKLKKRAKEKGFSLSERGLYLRQTGELIEVSSEKDVFYFLGLEYIEPYNR